MAFEGLIGKMRKGLAVAALGLASLMPTQEADAQLVNLGLEIKDSNGQIVNSLQSGNTYFGTLTLQNISGQTLDFSSLSTQLEATFAYPAEGSASSLNLQYTAGTPAGMPQSGDLFTSSNAVMTKNDYILSNNSNITVLDIDRVATDNYPQLGIDQSVPFATFYFTPQASSPMSSVNFRYLDGSSTSIWTATSLDGPTELDNVNYVSFMNGSEGGVSYSLAAVPEPSTYAAWAGAAALAGAAWHRRRQRKNAVATKTA